MVRAVRHFLCNTQAAAAVELALILPMAFALLFTCFEGGAYMWNEHKVVKAVREGARYAGRQPFGAYTCDSVDPEVESRIQRLVRTGNPALVPADQERRRIKDWTDNGTVFVILDCDSNTTGGIYNEFADGAPRVMVSAVVQYPSLLGALGFDTSNAVVRAQSQAAVMGL